MTNLFNSKIAYTLVLVLVSVISFMFSLSIHQPSSEPSISEINYKLLCQEIAGDPRDEQSGMIGNEDLSAVPGMKLSDFVEICEIAYEKNKGDLNTKHNLARAHMANNDYETAYDILIELSEQDYPQAKQTLREYNWNNNFPEVSYDMEMELLVQSARLGLPHAVGLAYSYWTRVNHTVEVEKRISRRELTDLLVSSANNSLNGYPSAIVYENYQEISEFIASDPTLSTNLREEHFYQEKAFYDGYINRSDIEIPKLEKWQVCYVLQNFAQKFIEPFAILGDNRETRIVERFHLAFNYDEFPEEFVDLLKENCTGLRTNKPQSASQYVVGLYSDFLVNGELNLAEILIELESMRDVEFYPDILSKLAPNVDLFVEEDEDQYLDFFIEEAENYFKSVGANTRFLIPWYHFLVE